MQSGFSLRREIFVCKIPLLARATIGYLLYKENSTLMTHKVYINQFKQIIIHPLSFRFNFNVMKFFCEIVLKTIPFNIRDNLTCYTLHAVEIELFAELTYSIVCIMSKILAC